MSPDNYQKTVYLAQSIPLLPLQSCSQNRACQVSDALGFSFHTRRMRDELDPRAPRGGGHRGEAEDPQAEQGSLVRRFTDRACGPRILLANIVRMSADICAISVGFPEIRDLGFVKCPGFKGRSSTNW